MFTKVPIRGHVVIIICEMKGIDFSIKWLRL